MFIEAITLGPHSVELRWGVAADGSGDASLDNDDGNHATADHDLGDEEDAPWNCPSCTFQNDDGDERCAMCGSVRPEQTRSARARLASALEFQVRYVRSGRTMASWKSSPVTTERRVVLGNLEPNTVYKFQLRHRRRGAGSAGAGASKPKSKGMRKKLMSPRGSSSGDGGGGAADAWQDVGAAQFFVTFSTDEALRVDNLARVREFLTTSGMPPYPEDPPSPDGVADKLERAGGALMEATKLLGVGGAYARLARNVLALHRTGLASVVFREDIQQLAIALARNVGAVGKEFGLSRMDVTVGCYYMLWEHKRARLLQPDLDRAEHAAGAPGVLQERASADLLDEAAHFLGFAQLVYRKSAAQMQWVLRNYPRRDSGFELLACKPRSDKFRPAFALCANRRDKLAVLAIRGTKETDDMITNLVHEFEEARFTFQTGTARTFRVHAGMMRAARWLARGGPAADAPKEPVRDSARDVDMSAGAGGGMGHALGELARAGYGIAFAGHSLGAGVAVLLALIVANENPRVSVRVYGVGTPACVDEPLAEACKGRSDAALRATGSSAPPPVEGLGDRVRVLSLVNCYDLVPRLSLFNARLFASDIARLREHWAPLLREDRGALVGRAKTLWAPPQRGQLKDEQRRSFRAQAAAGVGSAATPAAPAAGAHEAESEGMAARLLRRVSSAREAVVGAGRAAVGGSAAASTAGSDWAADDGFEDESRADGTFINGLTDPPERMVVPGLVLHVHNWRGARLCSLVDYRFPGLRRIEASENLIVDHRIKQLPSILANVRAARAMGAALAPPAWQSIEDHLTQGLYVKCSTCRDFIGWHYTGDSEAVEVRAAQHCRSCGLLVCGRCSKNRLALPRIGIASPVRVCDVCYIASGDLDAEAMPLQSGGSRKK